MLKIKDNVNLNQLEKFGFSETQYYFVKLVEFAFQLKFKIVVPKDSRLIVVDINDFVTFPCNGTWQLGLNINRLNTLYDLIKADLVEKIEK